MSSAPKSGPEDPILTPAQGKILTIFASSPLARSFYFGGATALSAVYFQHRFSEDLDFFGTAEFTARQLTFFEKLLRVNGYKIRRGRRLPVYIYEISAPDGSTVKLDFSYYPYDRIDRGTTWRGIDVDSILDMAVNKIHAIASRFEDKDLVDLYFLLTLRPELDLMDLIRKVPLKFDARVHPLTLAEKLMRAGEIKLMPRLVRPLPKAEIQGFLSDQARRIVRRVGPAR